MVFSSVLAFKYTKMYDKLYMTLLFQYHTFITAEILLELALSANQSINLY